MTPDAEVELVVARIRRGERVPVRELQAKLPLEGSQTVSHRLALAHSLDVRLCWDDALEALCYERRTA